jgi:hypothetical protein
MRISGFGRHVELDRLSEVCPRIIRMIGTGNEAVAPLDGAAVARGLASLDPTQLESDELLDAIDETRKLAAWNDAQQMRLMAAFATRRPAVTGVPGRRVRESYPTWLCEYAPDELAPVLQVSPAVAQDRLLMAIHLTDRLPATMTHLTAGRITLAHARTISERTGLLDDPAYAHTVEDQVLAGAAVQTPTQLRRRVDRAVIGIDPNAAETRRVAAVKTRRVEFEPFPDGLASLWLVGPAEQIAAARTGIEAVARRNRRALGVHAGDPADEGIDAFRFDAAIELLTGHQVVDRTEVDGPLVQVTMAATTALGLDDAPAELAGHGPITAQHARTIAHTHGAHWQRILTDPASGVITDISSIYRPSARMAALVRARNPTCVFPGCTRKAEYCDLDHTIPYPYGHTAVDNLGPLCRHHHRLKTHGRWKLKQLLDGTWEWTSPTGRIYYVHPDNDTGNESPPPEPTPDAAPDTVPADPVDDPDHDPSVDDE